jgi:hypothetical protein
VAIPLSVAGTLDRPAFHVDFAAVAGHAVTKSITDRIADVLTRRDTTRGREAPEPAIPQQPRAQQPRVPEPRVPEPTAQQAPPTQPPAPKPPARSPAPTPSPPPERAAAEDLLVRVEEHAFRGSMLAPNIEAKGVVAGRRLAGLLVVVHDDKGREVHRATLLRQEIAAAYGNRPRTERISVPFSITIPAGNLPHLSTWFKVQLAAVSEDKKISAPDTFIERKADARAEIPGN